MIKYVILWQGTDEYEAHESFDEATKRAREGYCDYGREGAIVVSVNAIVFSASREDAQRMQENEQLGIIGTVHVGLRDIGKPCLWFGVTLLTYETFFVFIGDDMLEFIRKANKPDLTALKGAPCVVRLVDGAYQFVRIMENK